MTLGHTPHQKRILLSWYLPRTPTSAILFTSRRSVKQLNRCATTSTILCVIGVAYMPSQGWWQCSQLGGCKALVWPIRSSRSSTQLRSRIVAKTVMRLTVTYSVKLSVTIETKSSVRLSRERPSATSIDASGTYSALTRSIAAVVAHKRRGKTSFSGVLGANSAKKLICLKSSRS